MDANPFAVGLDVWSEIFGDPSVDSDEIAVRSTSLDKVAGHDIAADMNTWDIRPHSASRTRSTRNIDKTYVDADPVTVTGRTAKSAKIVCLPWPDDSQLPILSGDEASQIAR